MKYVKINKKVAGPGLYNLMTEIRETIKNFSCHSTVKSGVLHLFNMHTSSALTINESYDPSAKRDLERFLNYLAPKNLPFIEHTLEGADDSPAHMKAALLNQHLALIVEEGEIVIGQWQGVYLAEFRDHPKERTVLVKFQPDLT